MLFRRNIPADENEADVYMKEQPELHVESKSEKLFQGCSRDPTALIVHGNTAVNEQKVNLKEQQEFHVESKSDRLFQKCDRLFQESFRDPNIVVNSNKDVEFKDVIEINSEEDELTETYDSSKEDAIEIESDCESISLKLTEIPDPIIDIDSDIEMISLDTGNQENMTIEFYSENENSHQNIDHRPKKVFETKTERMASCPNQNKEPKQLNRVATIESDSDDSPQTDASWRNKVCYIEIQGSSQNKHDSQSTDAQDNESDVDLGVEVKKHNGPVKTYSRRWPDAGSPSGALNQRLFSKQAKRQYTNSCKVTKAKIPVTVGCDGKVSDAPIDDDRNQALESFIYYMECHGFSVPATARGLLQNESTRTIRRSERNRSEDQAVNKSNHLYQNFFSRYPEISRHLLNRIAVDRQQFPSVTTKKSFLDTILSLYGVKDMPERIYNCAMFSWKDEYSTSAGHGNVEDCQGWSNQLTVTVCVCADGGMMPAIVKVQNSNERCNGLGYLDLQSDLTNIDRYVFLDWFKSHFLTKCTQKKPICLLMDCDGDNLSLPLLEMAIEKNVVVIGLPTEIRQPTHVQVIEPLKAKLQRNAATSRDEFISLLKEVLTNVTAASIKEAYQDMYNCPLSQDLKGKKGDNTNLTGKRFVSEEKTKTKKCYTQPSLEPDLRATVYLKRMRELDTNEYKIYA